MREVDFKHAFLFLDYYSSDAEFRAIDCFGLPDVALVTNHIYVSRSVNGYASWGAKPSLMITKTPDAPLSQEVAF